MRAAAATIPRICSSEGVLQKLNGTNNADGGDDDAGGVENRRSQCIEPDQRLIVTAGPAALTDALQFLRRSKPDLTIVCGVSISSGERRMRL